MRKNQEEMTEKIISKMKMLEYQRQFDNNVQASRSYGRKKA